MTQFTHLFMLSRGFQHHYFRDILTEAMAQLPVAADRAL